MKARVVPMTAHGLKAARLHLAYIEREGVEADGSHGRLYGAEPALDRAVLAAPLPGERHQFRFILSPEDSVDLTLVVRRLMGQVERDLGVKLRWGAVNHHDTAHPHAHVVVRGVDRDGQQVVIDRAYIANRMRWQAQHILTEELGPRLDHDVERQLDGEVGQERLTSLDRHLASLLGPAQTIDLRALGRISDPRRRGRLVGRLRMLETLQVADRTARTVWRLRENWQEALRELGEHGDVIKRIHRALGDGALRSRGPTNLIDGRDDHAPIEGVVRARGLHDELRGDGYLIVEATHGAPVYTRVDLASVDAIPDHAVVRITVERQAWAKPMDRVLEQVAAENGGLYDPASHERALSARSRSVAGQRVEPAAVVAANLRRLARLERHRLVSGLPDGRWRVPPDLVRTLQEREVTHPRRLVRIQPVAPPLNQQITLRAPAWLDRQDPKDVAASPALAQAVAARAAFLGPLGIPAESGEPRLRALEELERTDLARHLGRQRGSTPLATPPVGMRGRLTGEERGASGTVFACLIDDAQKQIVVLPMTPSVRALAGHHVTVSRDAGGGLRLQPTARGRGA